MNEPPVEEHSRRRKKVRQIYGCQRGPTFFAPRDDVSLLEGEDNISIRKAIDVAIFIRYLCVPLNQSRQAVNVILMAAVRCSKTLGHGLPRRMLTKLIKISCSKAYQSGNDDPSINIPEGRHKVDLPIVGAIRLCNETPVSAFHDCSYPSRETLLSRCDTCELNSVM